MNFKMSLFVFLLLSSLGYGQHYTSKVIDTKTQKGIPYATVQYAENRGVITNEEGRFSFFLEEKDTRLDSIQISSIGYAQFAVPFTEPLDSIIFVTPQAIELGGVYVFDNNLTVEEIIEKVEANLFKNYNTEPIKQRFFLRQSSLNRMDKLVIDFKKSSIEELSEKFIDSVVGTLPRSSDYYTETLGDFLTDRESIKLEILKAAELYDKENNGSFEQLGERLETIFKENVKPDSYLKIKSGLFGEKIPVDSILEDEDAEALEGELREPEKSYFLNNRKWALRQLHRQFLESKKLTVLKKLNKYNFELVGYTDIDGAGAYVISYVPKRGADFKGKLYVNIEDFAVVRMDYQNVKSIKKLRLLGISFNEHTYKGSTVFSKFGKDKYDLKFVDFTLGRRFGVDRPLKVIEKNKNVKGRRKQNELSLALDIINNNIEKFELIVFDSEAVDKASFDALKEDESIKATYLARYNPAFWGGYTIVEPNAALRAFAVEEEIEER